MNENDDLKLVRAVAEILTVETDIRTALERTLERVAERLGLRTGWVWLVDDDSGQFFSGATLRLPPFLQEPVRMTGNSCWCLDSFREGKLRPENIPVMQCSRLREAIATGDVAATEGLRAHASVPLVFRDRRLGILNIAGPEWRRLTAAELELLATIAYQVAGALERARLTAEEARLVRAEERARLAREIHDTLAQDLTGIALHIEGALANLERNPERARQRLDTALERTHSSLEEARRSVLALRAAPLDGKPLPDALEALGRRFASETGIPVRIAARSLPDILRPAVENELYRIAQESLNNIRRHAIGATEVVIRLATSSGQLRLSVADNGCGCSAASDDPGTGQGIPGMRERARSLGGGLRVLRGRSGKGFVISVRVPLSARTEGAR